MDKQKKNHANKLRLVAETLEARVLYSADSLSALGSALLQDHHDTDADHADAFAHLNNVEITKADITEVVFIDSRVPEYQSIVDDIKHNKADTALVVVIDSSENGVEVIEKTLAELQDVNAVHVISHSLGDSVRLGSEFLSINTIDKHEQSIIAWSNALSAQADILFYGCDIGSTEGGIELMNSLAKLTGADIGLTENKTGTIQTGADWVFEVSSGPLNYSAAVSYELQQSWDHVLYNWDAANRVLLIDYTNDKFNDSFDYSPGGGNTAIQNLLDSAIAGSEEISLREAVYTSNNVANSDNQFTIRLINGTYTIADGSGDHGSGTQKDLVVTNDITIEGNSEAGTILQVATTDSRAFNINAENHDVSLSDFTITGGSITGGGFTDGGGAIRIANGAIVLTDITIDTNRAGMGGGVYIYGGTLEVINGNFIYNTADGTNLVQGSGGGILTGLGLSEVTINGTYFQDNDSNKWGGGVAAFSPIAISNAEFFRNSSYGVANGTGGGAIAGAALLTIQDTIVNNNYSAEFAGGIYANSALNLAGSTITNNTAETFGGGVHTNNNSSTITGSTIELNQANDNSGGGVFVGPNAELSINDSIINSNWALATSTSNGYGAGIIVEGQLNLNNSTVAFNQARAFAGVGAFTDAILNVYRTTFFENDANEDGGALGAGGNADVTITNATMVGNKTNDEGSAIYKANNSTITVANTIIDRDGYHPGHSQIFNENTAAGGIDSGGYNLITGNNDIDPISFPDVFNQHHTDLVGKNNDNKDFDPNLDKSLSSAGGSHSQHLIVNPTNKDEAESDAVDAAGNFDPLKENQVLGWRDGIYNVDPFGNAIDAFIDIGAVEYVHPEQPTKLFWIDKSDNSIWRMNADATGLQQIVPAGFKHGELREYIDLDYDPNTGTLFTLQSYNTATTTYEITYVNADGSTPDDMTPLVFQGTGYTGGNPTAPRAIDILPSNSGQDSFLYVAQNTESPTGSLAENYISKYQLSTDNADTISNIATNWNVAQLEITLPTATTDGGSIDDSSLITSLDVSLASSSNDEVYVYGDAGSSVNYDILSYNPSVNLTELVGRDRISPATVAAPSPEDEQTVAVYGAVVNKYFLALHSVIQKGPSIYGAYGTTVEDTETGLSVSDIAFDYNYDNNTPASTNKDGRIWYVDDAGEIGHITGTLQDKKKVLDNNSLNPTKIAIASIVAAPILPTITSDGGGATSSINVEENQTAVTSVTATPGSSGYALTYEITGGADAALFNIDAANGNLTFLTAPEFNTPTDVDTDGIYEVNVRAYDIAGEEDTQQIAVTVVNVNDDPVITSDGGGDDANLNAAENQTAVTSVTADDPDPDPDTYTYSLSGADSALFSIDSNGVLTFLNPPDFETDSGSGPSGEFEVTVTVDDGSGGTDSQNLNVTLTNANEQPVINNGNQLNVTAPENQLNIASVPVVDPDAGDTLTYSIVGGSDQANISIDSSTGALTFNTAPDFENPTDANTSGAYTILVRVEDAAGDSDTQTVVTTITDANDVPAITSNGGGDNANLNAAENQTAVTSVTADDPDPDPDTYTYSLSGADSALFSIDTNGVLTFLNPPDFETDSGSGPSGEFEVTVTVDDGSGGTDSQNLMVTLTNVNEAPDIPGGHHQHADTPENQTNILAVTAVDPDVGDTLSYSIVGGADASIFSIDASTGELSFNTAPDFENPIDADADGEYVIHVVATDVAGDTDDDLFYITVTDESENPVITSDGGGDNASISAAENQTAVTNVTASDPDAEPENFTYSLSGADSALFNIDTNGVLTFNNPPNFETDSGSGPNGEFEVTVTVDNGPGGTDSQNLTVTLTNVNEQPDIPGGQRHYADAAENQTSILTVAAVDPDAGDILSYSIAGGVDASIFSIDASTGELSFNAAPDFENPVDADADGEYIVQVEATDVAGESDTDIFYITVTDENEDPVITSNGGEDNANIDVVENQTAVTNVTATDPDTGIENLSYALSGLDSSQFNIDTNGVLLFNNSPNFETDSGSGPNGEYEVSVTVNDGAGGSDTQILSISVTNDNEMPSQLSLSNSSINENTDTTAGTTIGKLISVDPDTADTASYSIIGGDDASVFRIGGAEANELILSDGVLDYERQAVYSVFIRVSDAAGLYTDQQFEIDVTGLNEEPQLGPNLPDQVATENEAFTYTIPIESFSDPENDTLTYSVVSELPTWLNYDQQNRTLSGTPTDADVKNGPVTVEVKASDSQLQSSTSAFLNIELIDINQQPIDIALDTPTINATQADPYLIGVLSTTDPDANDAHTYTVNDERFEIVGHELKFAPNAETNFFENEEIELDVVSTDTGNLTTIQSFTIQVNDYLTIAVPPTLGAAVAQTPAQIELEPTVEPTTVTSQNESEPTTQTTSTTNTTTLSEEPESQQNAYVEEVDLASLIAPLEKITLEEIALLQNTISPLGSKVDANQLAVDLNNRLDFEFESGFDYTSSGEFREMAVEFDRQREELEKAQTQYKTLIGSSFTLSSGLSVGYLLWLIRGGTLMGSVLSSLPAWRMVDPLPVLGSMGEDAFEDEESLETMVDDDPKDPGSETDKEAA